MNREQAHAIKELAQRWTQMQHNLTLTTLNGMPGSKEWIAWKSAMTEFYLAVDRATTAETTDKNEFHNGDPMGNFCSLDWDHDGDCVVVS